ncbi:hypothetical protein [Siccirubricoccus phaeus]|uniref:hypothetical protein n=1 Tax=Siccirubricoccus phaeus TaxID=2595053 RepID=UPI001F335F3C|nr:hypothetical protein [Siccirubricoccus phaeus]
MVVSDIRAVPRRSGEGASLRRWCRLLRQPASILPCALAAGLALAGIAAEAAPTRRDTAMEAARRFLCPHGGAPVPGQRGRCRPARVPGPPVAGGGAGWDAGLPPPSHQQGACPEGTRPAAVLGQPGMQRCLAR